jgi:hypothetical protein
MKLEKCHVFSAYFISILRTEHGLVVNSSVSYLGGPGFKSWPRNHISWVLFFYFSQSPQADARIVPMTTSFLILLDSLFTYQPLIWCCVVWVTEKVPLSKL